MEINYNKLFNKNLVNFFRDLLKKIEIDGLQDGNHLYINFDTNNPEVKMPTWLKVKHHSEMTIVIQYEYWNFKVKKNSFMIDLSFDDIKAHLDIPFDSVISFIDPFAKFGLALKSSEIKKFLPKKEKTQKVNKNNIVELKNYKKKLR